MKILGREAESLDISPVRTVRAYKVVVYQKEGDCRKGEFGGMCRNNCHGIYMSVEVHPSDKRQDTFCLPRAIVPPFTYVNEVVKLGYGLEEPEELNGLLKEGKLILCRDSCTKLYVTKRDMNVIGVKREECGMESILSALKTHTMRYSENSVENAGKILFSITEDMMGDFPFFDEIAETFDGIVSNSDYFRRNARIMSEDEILHEASEILAVPGGEYFLTTRFGEDFVSRLRDFVDGRYKPPVS